MDKYPVRVKVQAKMPDGGQTIKVWSGRQQDLFSKYASKRTATMNTIKSNLQTLKEDIEE